MAQKITAEDLRAALALRCQSPAWALFDQVSDRTGGGSRYADAVAMSLWPSRGLEVHGFEIKVSRGDWLRELKDPKKSIAIQRYCDRWWIVAPPDIVQDGELPATWGLLVLRGKQLRCEKEAPTLKAQPLDRDFIAALLRRAAEGIERGRKQARREGFEEGCVKGPEEHRQRLEAVQKELQALQQSLELFEQTSGIQINRWNGKQMGEAVNKVLWILRTPDPAEHLRRSLSALQMQVESLSKEISAIEEAKETV